MEHIVPKLATWEQILDHFSTHSYFAPKWRCPFWMGQTVGRAQVCFGKFGCMLLSWILHNSNEGGQVWACLDNYKYICSSFLCHRLLDYCSDLNEIVLAKCSLKGKMSNKCKVITQTKTASLGKGWNRQLVTLPNTRVWSWWISKSERVQKTR